MALIEKLRSAQKKTGSMLCVGLDPDLDKLPPKMVAAFDGRLQPMFYEYLTRVIRMTAPHACAFKPNMAFYEALGPNGISVLETICALIKNEHPDHVLIVDGKRGDIGNSAEKYAAALKNLGADAVTVNPYLGPGTLKPFLDAGLGIIALCVTSNTDAAAFQGLICDGKPVYRHVAEILTKEYGSTGNLGLVTGATHPKELGEIRKAVGDEVVLLIPGIGKQEGNLEATVHNNGHGLAVINVSSNICHASSGDDYAMAAGSAAEAYNQQINNLRALPKE
ncbi:MAG: orotidine-5'-phosphate decarboxylase [Patescibacteria group bacterium]